MLPEEGQQPTVPSILSPVEPPPDLTLQASVFLSRPGEHFDYLPNCSIGSEFECVICTWPLANPKSHPCGNLFCSSCCETLKSCPICRGTQPFEICVFKPILNVLEKLEVVCKACQSKVKRGQFSHHYNSECLIPCPNHCETNITRSSIKEHWTTCSKVVVRCPFHECTCTFEREKASAHISVCDHGPLSCSHCKQVYKRMLLREHEENCSEADIDCPGGCQESIKRKDLEEHKESCPEVTVPCEASDIGCRKTEKRALMEEHRRECLLVMIRPTIEGLKQEVKQLKDTVAKLEGKAVPKEQEKPSPSPQTPSGRLQKSQRVSSQTKNPRVKGAPVTFVDVGAKVRRGKDWHWGNQDGNHEEGEIVGDGGTSNNWARVKWATAPSNCYEVGANGKYSLEYA